MSKHKNPTIAIIDSGIGGVAVLKKIIAKYKAGNYIYFADNLFMPYGSKNKIWLKKRVDYIIKMLKEHYNVDYLIIACNTASTIINESDYQNIKTMKFNSDLTYFATKLTKSNMPNLNVIADNTLAKQIEKHMLNKKLISLIIKRHIKQHKLNELKEFVLGCTHYELVKDVFEKHCANSKVINNSSFVLNKLSFKFDINDLNVVVLLSKNDCLLENKIYQLIRS